MVHGVNGPNGINNDVKIKLNNVETTTTSVNSTWGDGFATTGGVSVERNIPGLDTLLNKFGFETPAYEKNIYDYIKSKDELSLADAMLMMKYVDKTTQKEILELIKKAQIKPDGRFKSTTFSRDFARSWIGTCSNYAAKDQPKILAKLNLEEGCEGYFVQGSNCGAITGGNGQCEFILNNKATHMTVKDVTFDPEKNIFNIEYDVFQ